MSESMTVEQKMARSVETWRKCDPILMASQSQAALTFAFRDMKRDILVLADEVERLNALCESLNDTARHNFETAVEIGEKRDALQARAFSLEKERDELRFQADQARKTAQFHKDNHIAAEAVIDELRRRVAHLEDVMSDELIRPSVLVEANQIEGGA